MTIEIEKQLQVLLDAGIDPSIAESMLAAMTKQETKEKRKKKGYFPGFNSRQKINVPVVVEKTCVTCGTVSSHKAVKQVWSDEAETEHKTICNMCENCVRLLESLDKEALVSLFIIQNHPLMELRQMGNAQQIKMAQSKSPIEWLTTKMPNGIGWADKDDEEFIPMPDVKLHRR